MYFSLSAICVFSLPYPSPSLLFFSFLKKARFRVIGASVLLLTCKCGVDSISLRNLGMNLNLCPKVQGLERTPDLQRAALGQQCLLVVLHHTVSRSRDTHRKSGQGDNLYTDPPPLSFCAGPDILLVEGRCEDRKDTVLALRNHILKLEKNPTTSI